MTICVFAEVDDLVPGYVALRAKQRGEDVIWLSESKLGDTWSFNVDDRHPLQGRLMHEERQWNFNQLSGAYVNLNPKPPLPFGLDLSPQDQDTFMGARRASIRQLTALLPCPVANRLHAGRSNNSKAFQMRILDAFGFQVPDWIVSNDLMEVERFSERYEQDVICKSISGLRSRVKKIDDDMRERLSAGTTPIIAQQYINGRDVRVHTVNGKAFATEIQSHGGVDYRFDEGDHQYNAISIPADLEARCHRFADKEEMVIAGFDFRLTDSGVWYCLEMNPFPTFVPYELETGQPICSALLDVIGSPG